ncbi:MAG: hypothetical protein HZC02_03260 [Candidatus Levybacteria bacterium]|nr:hypothetical protein [Candidatus Levybacteria bacterium]
MPNRFLDLFKTQPQDFPMTPERLDLMATLWPTMPHFATFATDHRLSGIRLNRPMVNPSDLAKDLEVLRKTYSTVPMWYDIKSRQIRVAEVHDYPTHLEVTLNHPISLNVDPARGIPVELKSGSDHAILIAIADDGKRLIFAPGKRYGPRSEVVPGDSMCIRNASLSIQGPLFTDLELEKIEMVKAAGFTRFFLSYVESEEDVGQFLDLVGHDATVMLKIESPKGMTYVRKSFKPQPNVRLMAARGDLYVELPRPHHILQALEEIIQKDPEACVGSRIFLSLGQKNPITGEPQDTPECADFSELAYLYNAGFRTMMLCDHVCLDDRTLSIAIAAFDSFRQDYALVL